MAADPALQPLLRARAARGLATLLTPHPLEAARLLRHEQAAGAGRPPARPRGGWPPTSAPPCCSRARAASSPRRAGCRTSTRPATPRWPRAGTGDVLAGWAGGLWAQQPQAQAVDVAAAAAWQHGRAADLAHAPPAADAAARRRPDRGAGARWPRPDGRRTRRAGRAPAHRQAPRPAAARARRVAAARPLRAGLARPRAAFAPAPCPWLARVAAFTARSAPAHAPVRRPRLAAARTLSPRARRHVRPRPRAPGGSRSCGRPGRRG